MQHFVTYYTVRVWKNTLVFLHHDIKGTDLWFHLKMSVLLAYVSMSLWKLDHILTGWSIVDTCHDPSKETSANTGHKVCLLSFHLYFMLTCSSTETVLKIRLFTYLWSWCGALQLGRVHLIMTKTSCLLDQNTSRASLQDTWKRNVV